MNPLSLYTSPQYSNSSPKTRSAESSDGSMSSTRTTASQELYLQQQYDREHSQQQSDVIRDDGVVYLRPVNAMYCQSGVSSSLPRGMNATLAEQYSTFGDYNQAGGHHQTQYQSGAPLAPATPMQIGNQRLPHDPYNAYPRDAQQLPYPSPNSANRPPLSANTAPNMLNSAYPPQASGYAPFGAKHNASNSSRNVPRTAVAFSHPAAAFVPDAGASAQHSHLSASGDALHRFPRQQQQMPLGYAQASTSSPGHGQQYDQGYAHWQGQGYGHVQGGSPSSSASPHSFVSDLSIVSPGPSVSAHRPPSTRFIKVPLRPYEKGGNITGQRQPPITFKEAGAMFEGVRLSHLDRLLDPNTQVTTNMKSNQTVRVLWPGYADWDFQLPGRNERSPKTPKSRFVLATRIAEKMGEFIKIRENERCSEHSLRWRVGGHDGLKVGDLYLVELQHISQGSWCPVFHVRADRLPRNL